MATTQGKRACPVCGTLLADDGAMCPVCALRGALEQGQETVELELDLTPSPASRFDHYQLLTREDETLFELGHGAMG